MTMGDAMRITPLDIQQMVFKVAFRGYDKEEVNRFLEELAQTVESLNRDHAVQQEKSMQTVNGRPISSLRRLN